MIKICNTYSLDDLPLGTKGRVIALGLFDGIHQGHKDIIRKAVVTAERDGLTSTVQTFRNLIKNDSRSLYSMEEKHELIGSLGADELFVLDFDAVKDMEPEQYLTDVLLYRAVADTLVLGEDYRFGRGAKGDVNLIREFAKANDIRVIVLKDHLLEGTGRKISTTWLREALSEGDADLARDLCGGRNYSYTGYCVQGKMMGRTMGFPTANINIPEDKFVVRRESMFRASFWDSVCFTVLRISEEDLLLRMRKMMLRRRLFSTSMKIFTVQSSLLNFCIS